MYKKTVKEIRKAKGWNLKDLSAEAKLDSSLLSRLENNRLILKSEEKDRVARALGCSVEDVLFPEAIIAYGS